MPESLIGPVMLIVTFFGAFFVVVTACAPLIIEAERPYASPILPASILDTFMDEYLTAWPPSPFEVDWTMGDDGWTPRSTPMVVFDPGSGEEHPLKCWLVRNDSFEWFNPSRTADYLVFQQIYGWLGMKETHQFVPYSTILAEYEPENNYSRFTVDLRYVFEVFIYSNGTIPLSTNLWIDHYNMTASVGINAALDSMSPWGMVAKIMTFRLPGTNWVIAALVAVPIYVMLFYMGFVIIRSCVPFLGG